jgi:hypothetical protein
MHMRKYVYTVLLGSLTVHFAAAQDDKIKTDRPSETQLSETVGKKTFQVESGLRYEKKGEEEYTFEHPQVAIRYGLLPKLEFRAEITPQTEKEMGEKATGLKPVELGLKLGLWDEKGALPQAALQTQVGMADLASDEFKTTHYYPRVRLLLQNNLTDKLQLGYNIGAEWNGESTTADWIYTLSPQLEVGDKVEVFIEEFARIRKGHTPEHYFDGGLACYVNNNVKWDLWGGLGLNHAASDYFVSTGISFRLK